jgi:putative phosphoribosyl transferase
MGRYRDRADAGRQLAEYLAHHRGHRPLVLGASWGGVLVGAEVASALEGSLDLLVTVPFGLPDAPDLCLGAVGPDGQPVVESDLLGRLGRSLTDLAPGVVAAATAARSQERAWRGDRALEVAGRTVIVVDDGVAGGATLRAALARVRRAGPARLVGAVPVGLPATIDLITVEADEVVCPVQPLRFHTAAEWYDSFLEVGEEQVAAALARGRA